MAIALIQEWPADQPGTEMYDAITARMNVHNSPPDGLIAHTAGSDSSGVWRIFDIWESREAAERFRQERLMPAVHEVASQQGGDPAPPSKMDMYELHDVLNP
ncbi:MAG: hypothetical protein NVSMB25_12660 [Thermoleophilaceae bacterium]